MTFDHPRVTDPDWENFTLNDDDLHFITNLLLEREVPLTIAEMAGALLERWASRPAKPVSATEEHALPVYRPAQSFAVGSRVRFPLLGQRQGKVIGSRSGENPGLSAFEVIQVEFEDDGPPREFAASLAQHKLNVAPPPEPPSDLKESPEEVLARRGKKLEPHLHEALSKAPDLVRIAGRWFPKALLAEIHDGHLNLAEAVLDVAQGGPLATREVLPHVELPPGVDPLLGEFSLDYALQEDERFDEVGPAGQVLWYLRRLEPPEVLLTPPRLEYESVAHDRAALSPAALELEASLDDELSPLTDVGQPVEEVTLSLLFPHWRVGTLPLSSRLQPLFPTANEAPRIRFILVDGHTGERFPGWVVREPRYVFGLDAWYQRHQVPCGGLIRVRRGTEKGEVIVEAVDRRKRTEWIRTLTVDEAGVIGFAMAKLAVGSAYDERMVMGVPNATALDEAWLRGPQRRIPLDRLVAQIFRELAKLNPQSAVHAQALYSGINAVRRVPPAPLILELNRQPRYEHVGDLYWRMLDESGGRA
jgi:hypothetical protein